MLIRESSAVLSQITRNIGYPRSRLSFFSQENRFSWKFFFFLHNILLKVQYAPFHGPRPEFFFLSPGAGRSSVNSPPESRREPADYSAAPEGRDQEHWNIPNQFCRGRDDPQLLSQLGISENAFAGPTAPTRNVRPDTKCRTYNSATTAGRKYCYYLLLSTTVRYCVCPCAVRVVCCGIVLSVVSTRTAAVGQRFRVFRGVFGVSAPESYGTSIPSGWIPVRSPVCRTGAPWRRGRAKLDAKRRTRAYETFRWGIEKRIFLPNRN